MFDEWYASLFKSPPREDIDPYQWKCVCGYKWKFNKFQLLRMFLFKYYTHTCPQCQRKSRYRMVSHVVRDINTKDIIEHNRWLE